MLTFEEKLTMIESFPELQRKDVSMGRINFHFEGSVYDKKIIVYHLHPNGNGFVYAEHLKGYPNKEKGMVNIRDFSADDLRTLIQKSILSLSPREAPETTANRQHNEDKEEKWMNRERETLILLKEDDIWNVYAGSNLDGTFNSYNEATEYLDEEGFSRK